MEALIAFISEEFGGTLLRRFDRPDGSLMHAEIRVDDGVMMVGGGATDAPATAPHVHLYVPDAAAAYARAIAAGAIPGVGTEAPRRR
ncbi:VOC family protein [Methylobacterium dankookense]|uniref:VOC domain-containing protein n=1 Tax=Methylobacterium dankookense TaxID=560405 RepID=A0A564FRL1_9HYPH|nr:hypothetical protein [Methylobacterium dankookense]GJD57990.1 hypothetical protein IFDJLNFL_3904 [Methylobacterium dankookense]VUF10448.1 hypothetical protein MTDSW087_00115 [Methylobacterium dankookense]